MAIMPISITSFARNSCETHMCKGNTVFKDMYLRMPQQQSLLDIHNCQFHSGVMADICRQCVNQ